MKKLFTVLLCGLIAMSLLSGCGSKKTEETPATVGAALLNSFNEYVKANPEATAMDIANNVITNSVIPAELSLMTMEIEAGYLNGFDNFEVTGFEQGAIFAPMMGTIPFVGYIFTLPAGADVQAFMDSLTQNANLRWNICTAADEMTVSNVDNTVFFVMAPLSFETAE
ncbi:MAG: hypothetical protein IKU28_07625 [Erysipelotrichaceae bacterium]|nr:hypothetical protein [Erysipelotrichaceae bacterium]